MAPPDRDEPGPIAPARRTTRLALLGLLLLVLVALLIEREGGDRLDRRLAAIVAERIHAAGGTVEWRSFDVSPWRGRLDLEAVELSWPLPGDDRLHAVLPSASVSVGWTAAARLALGRVHLSDVELDSPQIEIRRGTGSDERLADDGAVVARIDRLRVRGGTLSLEDRQLELELEASDIEVDARRRGGQRATEGRLQFLADVVRAPLTQPLPIQVDATFRWRSHDIELVSLQASGAGLRFEGEGRVGLVDGASAIGRGELRVNLGLFSRWLPREIPRLSGLVAGPVSVELTDGAPRVRGALSANELIVDRLRFDRLESTLLLAPGSLEALDIDASAFDGRVRGAARLDWREAMRLDADLRVSEARSEALLDWLGLPLPLAARVDGELHLEGDPTDLGSLVGDGRFEAWPTTAPGAWPTSALGTLRLDRGRVDVEAARLEIGRARLVLAASAQLESAGDGPLDLRLSGSTDEAESTRQATLAILASLGSGLPAELDHVLGGSGPISSSISRRGESTAISLSLDLKQARVGSERFDQAGLDLQLEGSTVQVRRVDLQRGTSRLEGAARFGIDPLRLDAVDLRAASIDAAWIGELVAIEQLPTGRVSGRIALDRAAGVLNGSGELTLAAGTWLGETIDQADASFTVGPAGIRVESAEAAGPAFSLDARGRLPLDATPMRVQIESGRVDLGRLAALDGLEPRPTGTARVEGVVRIADGEPRADLRIDGEDWRVGEFGPGPIRAQLRVDRGNALVALRPLTDGGWSGGLSVGLVEPFPFEALLEFDGAPIAVPSDQLDAALSLTGALELSGRLSDPASTRGRATLERSGARLGRVRLTTNAPLEITLEDGVIRMPDFELEGDESAFRVGGRIDLLAETLELGMEGRVGLAVAAAPRPELRARGHADVALTLAGPLDAPLINGAARVADGRLRLLGFPHGLDRLSLSLDVSDGSATLSDCRARLGNGELLADGEAVLDGLFPTRYAARLRGANVRFEYPEGFRGVYEGELVVDGTASGATLSGDVRLLRGLYDQSVTLLGLTGGGGREYDDADASDLPREVRLDVKLRADGNVWVRNEQAEVESRVDLQIGGTLQQPEVLGRVEMMRDGTVRVRDVEYTIDSGAVDLVDLQRIDPYLTLRAHTTIRDYTVYLRVEGTADRFEYELTSEPTLTTQDIIALLTTGSTLEDLTASGGATQFTGDLAANYFAGALTDRFERQLRGLLGFDRIEINPLLVRGGADPTTRVTLGKRVTRDIFVVFSSEIGSTERQLYQIEWQASRQFRLSAERDTLGGLGGEVRYADRFWWHRRHAQQAAAVSAEGARGGAATDSGGARVARVEIRGVDDSERGELRRKIELNPGDVFSRSQLFADVETLRRGLIRDRRIEAEVDAFAIDTDAGKDVIFEVRAGPRVLVLFEGVRIGNVKLRESLLATWVDSVDQDELWELSRRRVARWFRQRGYYAVDVLVDRRTEGDVRRVTFVVDRGKVVQVEQVALDGVSQVPEERVRRQMLTRPRSLFSRSALLPEELDKDLAAIRNLYRDLGFLDVRIDEPSIRLSIDGERAVVRLAIEEGVQYRIARIEVSTIADIAEDQLVAWSGLTEGGRFSPGRLLRAESELRAALDARGYADARVRASVRRETSRVVISFEIEPGELKRLGELVVNGNRLTHERIIRREVEVSPGDLLSRDALLRSQHQLYKLGIFRNVRLRSEPLGGPDPIAHRLIVSVDEAPPFSTSLGVGYDSEAQGRVSFSLGHENVGGWDRELAIQGRFSSLERRLQLVAKEPRLFGGRLPLLIDLVGERREEVGFTFERRATAMRVDREVGPRWKGYLRYGFQRVDLIEVSGGDPPDETRLGDLGIAFTRDTRDDPFSPRNGVIFALSSRLFAPALLSEESFTKHTARASWVRTFGSDLTLGSAVRIGVADPFGSTLLVPTSERFFAGGDSTLRGFARNRVGPSVADDPTGGEGLLLFNHELRFPLWRAVRGVLFYDAGNVWADAGEIRVDDLRHVLGTGVRLETPIGPLRLEYGRKLDRRVGESSGELFLAIGAAF